VAALALVSTVGLSACEKTPTGPLTSYRTLKGSASTVRWYSAPASSELGKTLYYGIEAAAATNSGPVVLIVPGGGGQAGEWYLRQARVYAQAGFRPYVACIATTSGMFVPAGPVTCPNTPSSHAADIAAGNDVVNLLNALRAKHPSVRTNARQLILVGDSYGGAAVLHAAAITGWGHPVVTVNGTNTWLSPTPPNVPSGDVDPAMAPMLQRINAPVVQFAGGQDDLVPAGVASSVLQAARSNGITTSKVVLTGSDHIEPLGGSTNADARCANGVIVDALERLADGQTVVSTTVC
jgi:pimeloyl-ACP methyl ester carboxylesterase